MKVFRFLRSLGACRVLRLNVSGVAYQICEFIGWLASLAVFVGLAYLGAETLEGTKLAAGAPASPYFETVKVAVVSLSILFSIFFAASIPSKYSDTRYFALPYLVLLVGAPFLEFGGTQSFLHWLAVFALYVSAQVFAENIANPLTKQERAKNKDEAKSDSTAEDRKKAFLYALNKIGSAVENDDDAPDSIKVATQGANNDYKVTVRDANNDYRVEIGQSLYRVSSLENLTSIVGFNPLLEYADDIEEILDRYDLTVDDDGFIFYETDEADGAAIALHWIDCALKEIALYYK
jgi:hypothetical protein